MDPGCAIGERQLVQRISQILGGVESDDCAAVDAGDRYLVATTDMLHRKADFPEIMNPWQMGWMAVAVSLSDIAAMGAEPSGILIAAGIPPTFDLRSIDELFSGFAECAGTYETRVIGGDLDSTDELTLTGCAFGFVEKDLILRRRGARPGDLLCTTGDLGAAGAGLFALQKGEAINRFVECLLEPKPRLVEGRALALSKSVSAMMDNSDGLALSLYDLSLASKVGFVVKEEALPLAPGLEEMVGYKKALELVLGAGGDFELVFAARPEMIESARKACELTVIGFAVEEGIWIEKGGERLRLEPKGYEHMIARGETKL